MFLKQKAGFNIYFQHFCQSPDEMKLLTAATSYYVRSWLQFFASFYYSVHEGVLVLRNSGRRTWRHSRSCRPRNFSTWTKNRTSNAELCSRHHRECPLLDLSHGTKNINMSVRLKIGNRNALESVLKIQFPRNIFSPVGTNQY